MFNLKSFIISSAVLAFFCASASRAAIIFSNPLDGTINSATNPWINGRQSDPNITSGGITRIGTNPATAEGNFAASNWGIGGAIDTSRYFTWVITPAPGYAVNLESFEYTGTIINGPRSFAFRTSNNFGANIGTPTGTGAVISLTDPQYQNITTQFVVRLYGYFTASANGTFGVNDFAFNGSVVQVVPEPTSLAGLALAGMAFLKRRQR